MYSYSAAHTRSSIDRVSSRLARRCSRAAFRAPTRVGHWTASTLPPDSAASASNKIVVLAIARTTDARIRREGRSLREP